MIKEINTQGKSVLYINTEPVVPIITRKPDEKVQLGSLTGNQHFTIDQDDIDIAQDNPNAAISIDQSGEKYTCVWPSMYLTLVRDLLDTAESIADRCMGLASTQIWDLDEPCPSIFVMRWPCSEKLNKRGWAWQEFINPQIVCSGKTLKLAEGCLSYPNLTIKKTRKANVTLAYQTLTEPRRRTEKFTSASHNWIPQVMQHECDHLSGKCIRSRNFKR
jgi:peptide deformylase